MTEVKGIYLIYAQECPDTPDTSIMVTEIFERSTLTCAFAQIGRYDDRQLGSYVYGGRTFISVHQPADPTTAAKILTRLLIDTVKPGDMLVRVE